MQRPPHPRRSCFFGGVAALGRVRRWAGRVSRSASTASVARRPPRPRLPLGRETASSRRDLGVTPLSRRPDAVSWMRVPGRSRRGEAEPSQPLRRGSRSRCRETASSRRDLGVTPPSRRPYAVSRMRVPGRRRRAVAAPSRPLRRAEPEPIPRDGILAPRPRGNPTVSARRTRLAVTQAASARARLSDAPRRAHPATPNHNPATRGSHDRPPHTRRPPAP
jgi:hypothetical protein